VSLGREVSIAPLVFIGPGVHLGDRVTIMPGCVIGDAARIGADTLLYPNVTLLERCAVGRRCVIHSGTVIGSDGFGFVPGESGHVKIPQLGTVVIEDDVEIGANCAIDRGALGVTRVGRGVKIDNLVHLAHNVEVGDHSFLVAQVGVSGSTKLGKNVTLAGQVGVTGHLEVGDGVQVGAQSGVNHSIAPGQTVSGSPVRPHREWLRIMGHLPKLPELYQRLKRLEQNLSELSARLKQEPES
jgi:UDP-3-O-[3-hydroxymyristoyl] glucosamine N-acyltransferase